MFEAGSRLKQLRAGGFFCDT